MLTLEPPGPARIVDFPSAALSRWAIDVERIEPIKIRENAVYAVHARGGKRFVLRIHRVGYHSDAALQSELSWMSALRSGGIDVPQVVPSARGNDFELIERAGGREPVQADVFEWIEGRALGSVEQGIEAGAERIEEIYFSIGTLAARLHDHGSRWRPPCGFQRHAWDAEGLMGENPLWGRFWALEALSPAQVELLEEARSRMSRDLARCATTADRFGLIHADLVPENILADGARMRVIDFDDAGFGWHLFEIATSLYFIRREPYYEAARDALISAYRRVRPLPESQASLLPLFLAARGTTYLGWLHTRRGEAAAQALAPQLIELALSTAADYLGEPADTGCTIP